MTVKFTDAPRSLRPMILALVMGGASLGVVRGNADWRGSKHRKEYVVRGERVTLVYRYERSKGWHLSRTY